MKEERVNTCAGCSAPLQIPHIQCTECSEIPVLICLRCFSKGYENETHHNNHCYTVIVSILVILLWIVSPEIIGDFFVIDKYCVFQDQNYLPTNLEHFLFASFLRWDVSCKIFISSTRWQPFAKMLQLKYFLFQFNEFQISVTPTSIYVHFFIHRSVDLKSRYIVLKL